MGGDLGVALVGEGHLVNGADDLDRFGREADGLIDTHRWHEQDEIIQVTPDRGRGEIGHLGELGEGHDVHGPILKPHQWSWKDLPPT